jgi:hypothetical protein
MAEERKNGKNNHSKGLSRAKDNIENPVKQVDFQFTIHI